MNKTIELSIPELERLFNIDDKSPSGLTWKVHMMKPRVGARAGSIDSKGYWYVRVNGRSMKVHRIVWAMANGRNPDGDIDHINGIVTDNRIFNLRSVCRSENAKNQKRRKHNTSGVTGVARYGMSGKWWAYIWIDGKNKSIGYFDSIEEATEARIGAEIKAGGYTERHGKC